jgi:hypothetical protein
MAGNPVTHAEVVVLGGPLKRFVAPTVVPRVSLHSCTAPPLRVHWKLTLEPERTEPGVGVVMAGPIARVAALYCASTDCQPDPSSYERRTKRFLPSVGNPVTVRLVAVPREPLSNRSFPPRVDPTLSIHSLTVPPFAVH